MEDVTFGTFFTHNGYKFFHYNNGNKITNIRIIVNTGSADECFGNYGLAHCLEHMQFKGTEKHTWKQVNNLAAELGQIGAHTDIDETIYYITCLSENFKKAFDLLCEVFFTPVISENDLKIEKNVILEEISTRKNDHETHYFDRMYEIFLGHSVGHMACGTAESVNSLTMDKLLDFRKQLYAMDNVLIAITGDVDICDIKKVFTSNYADLLVNSKQKITALVPEYRNGYFEIEGTSDQSIMSMIFKSVSSKYQFSTLIPEIFSEGFGSGMHYSILWEKIREKLGLVYNIGTNFCVYRNDVSMMYMYAFLEHCNVEFVREEIEKLLARVKERGFSKKLLKACKSSFLFDTACKFNDTVSVNRGLDYYFIDGYEPKTYENVVSIVSKITNEDIIKYANKVFNIDEMCFVKLVQPIEEKEVT